MTALLHRRSFAAFTAALLLSLAACEETPPAKSPSTPPPPRQSQSPPEAVAEPLTSADLEAPFDTPALNRALASLRQHIVADQREVPPPPDAILEARRALEEALSRPLASPADVPRLALLALRLFDEAHAETAASITAAVARLAVPALYDDLTLDLIQHLQRAAGDDLERTLALIEPLRDHPELPEAQTLLARTYARAAPEEEAAQVLAEMIEDGRSSVQNTLCAEVPRLLARSKGVGEQRARLANVARHVCAGKRAARIAAADVRRLQGLDEVLSPTARRHLEPTSELQIIKARRLYARVQHDAVLETVAPLIASDETPTAIRCEALWHEARTYRYSRRAALAAEPYEKMSTLCVGEGDWHMRSLYGQGWIAFLEGEKDPEHFDRAAPFFVDLYAQYPETNYGDDALLFQARIAIHQQDLPGAISAVEPILAGDVQGDTAGEAVWRVYEALRDADHPEARRLLERGAAALADDDTYYSVGRMRFAHAWWLEEQGQQAEAAREYEAIMTRWPLSYYAYISLEALRRRAEDTPEAAAALTRWRATVTRAREPAAPLVFNDLPTSPILTRAVTLARGGWGARAAVLARRADFALEEGSLGWFVALGYHLDGRYEFSHNLARRTIQGWQDHMPTPANRLHWTLAYPRPYLDIVSETSETLDVPAHLIYSVMREESGFRVHIESYAHALGLMQVLFKTAAWMAKKKFDRELKEKELNDPKVNIPIGAAYLSHLEGRLLRHLTLQASGYNAGGGRVRSWRRDEARENLLLPQLVESIPSRQTRDYSKRVTSSTLIYQVLYGDGAVERLPFEVPVWK